MKNAQKAIALLMVVIVIVTCFSITANAEMQYSIVVFVDIIAYTGSGSSSGNSHAFLLIRNASTIPITIGHMPVASGDYITVGTFGNRSAHNGIWYNIEGYAISTIKTSQYAKLSTFLTTSSEITTLNGIINSSDSWSLTNNCAVFSKNCWNSIAESSMQLSGITPVALRNSILSHGGQSSGITVNPKSIYTIAYHTPTSYTYDTSGATANGSS